MKIRNGFVSNSSSSSFILFKAYLSKEQCKNIKNWKEYAVSDEYKERLLKYSESNRVVPHNDIAFKDISDSEEEIPVEPFSYDDYPYYPDGWCVGETTNLFDFDTPMDNFDMEQFLNVIGVDVDKCGLWIEHPGSYISCLGLNDARTDLKNYVNDTYFMDDYDDKYYYTSKLYKEKVYPILKAWYDRQPENKFKGCPPHLPVKPKKWICEDAGKALNEATHEIKELACKNGVTFLHKMSNGEYFDEKAKMYAEVLDTIDKVKDNWKTVDNFEEPQSYTAPLDLERWNKKEDDDSQRVIAALEGEGFYNFSPEEEKSYNESIDKLYKPIDKNIEELKPEDC